jgi:hypothetical protein
MAKSPVVVELTWNEAANLLNVGIQADTHGWTRAAKGSLNRACEKLAAALPMDDPNAMFLIVRGQTVAKAEG